MNLIKDENGDYSTPNGEPVAGTLITIKYMGNNEFALDYDYKKTSSDGEYVKKGRVKNVNITDQIERGIITTEAFNALFATMKTSIIDAIDRDLFPPVVEDIEL